MIESGIIWWLCQHLLITAVFAAIVYLICSIVRTNPATRHVLWLLVLCRLLIPPMATWPWPIPLAGNEMSDMFHLRSGGTNGVDAVGGAMPAPIKSRSDSGRDVDAISPSPTGGNVNQAATVASETSKQVGASQRFPIAESIAGLWMAGSLIAVIILFRRIRRIGQLLKTESNVAPWFQNEIADWCDRLKVRAPDCVVHSRIHSPFLWCLGCVRLVWPLSALHYEQKKQVRPILIHELAHLKRRDHWTAWVELLALIVWWWNPVLWFIRRQLRISAEMACDAWVVELLPDQRRTYAESLVDFSNYGRTFTKAFGTVGANTCSRRTFKRRLEMIMKGNPASRFSKWAVSTVVLLGVLSLPAFAIKSSDQPEDSAAKSPMDASAVRMSDEQVARFNHTMNEQPVAENAIVSRNVGAADPVNSGIVPVTEHYGRALPKGQETSDPGQEASTIPKNYFIGVKDVLGIHVWKEPELSVEEAMVRPDGKISIPLVGDIQAGGLTPAQLNDKIEEKLMDFISSPVVTVSVLQISPPSVSIAGEIERPGVYDLEFPITVLELLARAGGCSEFADVENIAIIRKSGGRSRHYKFNYKDTVMGNNLEDNITLQNGDIVLVP